MSRVTRHIGKSRRIRNEYPPFCAGREGGYELLDIANPALGSPGAAPVPAVTPPVVALCTPTRVLSAAVLVLHVSLHR